jgi:uncharacterized membrane protein SpoIIM required for sporulation
MIMERGVDLDAFVSEHGAEWNRLNTLSRKRRRKLTAADIDELVALYRRTATHLSVVRSRSADPTLVAWLSRLVLQARAAVTPSTGFSVAAIGRFFQVSFPAAVYRSGAWCVGVGLAFLALAGVLMAMVANDDNLALSFLSEEQIRSLVDHDFAAYYSEHLPQNFAVGVWTNNTLVSAVCLAGGVLILPTLYMLWANVLNVGVVGGVMISNDRADVFFGLILVHGMLELTCVFVAAGVGLRVAWAWIAPGPYLTRTQSLATVGRSAMVVALGLAAPLFVSGIVEAFVTPLPIPIPIKLVFGAAVWLGFLAYIVILGGRATRAGLDADVAAHEREVLAPTV